MTNNRLAFVVGYNAIIISTIVDTESISPCVNEGYNAIIISTIVDPSLCARACARL